MRIDNEGYLDNELEKLGDELIEQMKAIIRPHMNRMTHRDMRGLCEYVGIHVWCQLSNERYGRYDGGHIVDAGRVVS